MSADWKKARKREKKETEWLRAYGSRERVRFVARLPCRVPTCIRGPSQNAHAETGGTGRKADARTILPLCRHHHAQLHAMGRWTFEKTYGINLMACAEWTEWKWSSAGDFPDLEY